VPTVPQVAPIPTSARVTAPMIHNICVSFRVESADLHLL
jgi:hypothetical protein